jgi:hypothetical protein
MMDRALSFTLAALNGYDASHQGNGRLTDEKIEMDEVALNILNRSFQILMNCLDDEPSNIHIFEPDEHKDGGAYIEVTEK